MDQVLTVQPVRFKVRFTPSQNQAIAEYLTRTTLLWNLLLHHLKDDAEAYLKMPASEESDSWFSDKVYQFFAKVESEEGGVFVSPAWADYLPKIKELSTEVLWSRLHDLVDAYLLAKSTEGEKATGLPRRKTAKSSQSVRFYPEDYTLSGDWVKVHSTYPFEFNIGAQEVPVRALLRKTPCTLSITRRRIMDQNTDTFGPVDEEDTAYTVTFRSLAEEE